MRGLDVVPAPGFRSPAGSLWSHSGALGVGQAAGGLCGVTSGDMGDGGSGAGCTGDDRGPMAFFTFVLVLLKAFAVFLGKIGHPGLDVGLDGGLEWICGVWAVVAGAGLTVAGLWDQGGRKKDRGVLWCPCVLTIVLGVGVLEPCCYVYDHLGGKIGKEECWAGLGGVWWGTGVFGEVPWCPRSSTTARCSRRSPQDFIHLDLSFPAPLPIL